MTNTAYLAVLHFFWWTFLRGLAMSEVLEVGILWCKLSLLAFSSLLAILLHPVVKLLACVVSGSLLCFLFLRSFGSVDLGWKVWFKGSRLRLIIIALGGGNKARQQE